MKCRRPRTEQSGTLYKASALGTVVDTVGSMDAGDAQLVAVVAAATSSYLPVRDEAAGSNGGLGI